MAKAKQEKVAEKQTAKPPQPLLYRNPVPILKDRHENAALSEAVDYNFAKATNSVPINAQEFAEVCKYYPIAFTADAQATPVAILGLEDKKNLFVTKMGDWKSNMYIPAYIRRYPFALMAGKDNELILCVDEGSERYSAKAKKGENRFFKDGQQSPLTQNAITYCAQYHRDFIATQDFAKELSAKGLLESKQVNLTLKGGKYLKLGGLQVVNEKKLLELDTETLQKWHKNGYLALIYFQILSGTNWVKLTNLLAK